MKKPLVATDEIREHVRVARQDSDQAARYHQAELLYETAEWEDPYDGTFLAGVSVNGDFTEREDMPESFFVAAVNAIAAAPAQVAALESVLEVLDSLREAKATTETPSEYARGLNEAASRLEYALSATPKPVVIYYPDSESDD